MEDLLKFEERIEITLKLGESYSREFKSAYTGPPGQKVARDLKDICHNIAKELVAFANADGGELFVGIEDDNSITGLPHDNEQLAAISDAPQNYVLKDTPLPCQNFARIRIYSRIWRGRAQNV